MAPLCNQPVPVVLIFLASFSTLSFSLINLSSFTSHFPFIVFYHFSSSEQPSLFRQTDWDRLPRNGNFCERKNSNVAIIVLLITLWQIGVPIIEENDFIPKYKLEIKMKIVLRCKRRF